MEKQNFYDLNFEQLKSFLVDKVAVDPKKAKMRSQQLFNAIYKKNIKDFDELTTFGVELRNKIKDLVSLEKPKIVDIQKSNDGTIKLLLELKDKRNVETVLIPDKSMSRYTILFICFSWLLSFV
jgi:Predicted Fe-S-cluster redox enzyme